jgi:hypothetical protein
MDNMRWFFSIFEVRGGNFFLNVVWLKYDHLLYCKADNLSCLNKKNCLVNRPSEVKEFFMCFYVIYMNKHVGIILSVFLLVLYTGARGTDHPLFLTFCLQTYFQSNFFISLLFHLFFLILTCSFQYSYNLMLTSNCMCRPYNSQILIGSTHAIWC